jgi:nitrate reductase gamma subunit
VSVLLWIVVPYAAFGSFVVGHIWRYRFDKFGWDVSSKRENPTRKLGLLMFRGGVLVLILTRSVEFVLCGDSGQSAAVPSVCRVLAGIGWAATVMAVIGALALMTLRIANPAGRDHTNPVDKMMLPLLGAILVTGIAIMFGTGDEIPHTMLFPWFRSLLKLAPRTAIMTHAPALAQLRAELVVLLIGIWPYTRLVSVFTAPIGYLRRRPVRPLVRAPKAT